MRSKFRTECFHFFCTVQKKDNSFGQLILTCISEMNIAQTRLLKYLVYVLKYESCCYKPCTILLFTARRNYHTDIPPPDFKEYRSNSSNKANVSRDKFDAKRKVFSYTLVGGNKIILSRGDSKLCFMNVD